MFAIGHAATALVLKRRFPRAPMVWLLVSVQVMEFLWVGLNYLGLERTTTERAVHSVSDIHLAYMPYSHSIASGIGLGLAAWLVISKGLGRTQVGVAIGLGVVSHLVLDLLTHTRDIALAPGLQQWQFGLGLYGAAPMVAFALEIAYGAFCWWVYRGGRGLLIAIVLFNLANLSFLSAAVPGPEEWLAGHEMIIVTLIAVQIVATLWAVWWWSRRDEVAG